MVRTKICITACLVLIALAIALPTFAADNTQGNKQVVAKAKVAQATAPSAASKKETDKQALIQQVRQDVGNLNMQQITVQVLGMQYQKELNTLQQLQQQFCKAYKLDLNKFQQGMYVFNEQEAKFVEQQPPAPAQQQQAQAAPARQ